MSLKRIFRSKSKNQMVNIKQLINTLGMQISSQPNPFLIRELIDLMRRWPVDLSKIPTYFPQWFRDKITQILSLVTLENQAETHLSLKKAIIQMPYPQIQFCQPACILLDTKLAKQLPKELCNKLIALIETTEQDSKINDFLQERFSQYSSESQFLDEITSKQLKGMKLPDLRTLIAQIIKTKPPDESFMQKLQKYKQKCQVFKNHLLQIKNIKDVQSINFKISNVAFKNNNYTFQGIRYKEKYIVKVKIGTQGLEKILIQIYQLQPFKIVLSSLLEMLQNNQIVEKQIWSFKHNKNYHSNSTILPQATYQAQILKRGHCFQIIFVEQRNRKKFVFQISRDKDGFQKVKYLLDNRVLPYESFVNVYSVTMKKVKQYDEQALDRYVQINMTRNYYQKNENQLFELIQRIQQMKYTVIGNILSLDRKQFDNLIEGLFDNNKITYQLLQQLGILEIIYNIVQLSLQIGEKVQIQPLVTQLLFKANYTDLVNKDETLNTIKAVGLFTQSETSVSSLNRKDIIAFYGNTGCGKSTSVNYLIGVPLQTTRNKFGDIIVQQKEQDLRSSRISSIGQSNGLSQTLFSKGYNIKDYQSFKNCQNAVLCDNPGFHDTRGIQYQICTNLSMDRSIELCNSIRSIVLVISYQTIALDRGNHLVELIELIQERFPNILSKNSGSFKNFFILVTKTTSRAQNIKALGQRFKEMCVELSRLLKNKNQSSSRVEMKESSERLRIFTVLQEMCKYKKIDVIDINDQIDRRELLNKYLSCNISVSKNQYSNSFTNSSLMKKFMNQISTSAHSWIKLILQQYSKEIPLQIQNNHKCFKLKNEQIAQQGREIENLRKSIKQLAQKTITMQAKLKSMIQNQAPQQKYQIKLNQPIEQPQFVFNYEERIKKCLSELDQLRAIQAIVTIKIKTNQKKKSDYNTSMNELALKKMEHSNLIKKWKQGEIEVTIIQEQYNLNQQLRYSSRAFSKKERLQYLNKGELLPASQNGGTYKCGQINKSFCNLHKISRDFILMSSKQFDPNQYIAQSNSSLSFGKYKAKITSNKFELQGVKLFQAGRTLLLSVSKNFVKTNLKQQLPFLKITHQIPSSQHYSESITNLQSEIRIILQKTEKIQQEREITFKERQQLEQQLQQLKIQQIFLLAQEQRLKQQNKDARQAKMKQLKAEKQKQTQRKMFLKIMRQQQKQELEGLISDLQDDKIKKAGQVEKKLKKVQAFQLQLKGMELKPKELQIKHKRFALLIKEQLDKRIPQTLEKFIDIAQNIIASKQKSINMDQDLECKQKNFRLFRKHFGAIKDNIYQVVSKHLQQ